MLFNQTETTLDYRLQWFVLSVYHGIQKMMIGTRQESYIFPVSYSKLWIELIEAVADETPKLRKVQTEDGYFNIPPVYIKSTESE